MLVSLLKRAKNVTKRCSTVDRHKYCVYKYTSTTFNDLMRDPASALARGTVVIDDTHVILPFTKFFNHWELPQQQYDIARSYLKLDGTLVVLWYDPITGALRGNTRGMLWNMNAIGRSVRTDGSGRIVNVFVKRTVEYARIQGLMHELEDTVSRGIAMFELVIPGVAASAPPPNYEQIIAKKGVPYLLAVRGGNLVLQPPDDFAWPFKPEQLTPEQAASIKDIEGVVAWAPNLEYPKPLASLPLDKLVKFKNIDYILRSGAIGWRNIIRLVLAGRADDILPIVSEAAEREALLELVSLAREVQEIVNRVNPAGIKPGSPLVTLFQEGVSEFIVKHGPKRPSRIVPWLRRVKRHLESMAASVEA